MVAMLAGLVVKELWKALMPQHGARVCEEVLRLGGWGERVDETNDARHEFHLSL